jgi:hypothetical protein
MAYFTRAKPARAAVIGTPSPFNSGYMLDADGGHASMTVHEDEKETFTGLFDAAGQEIHRSERVPLGFVRSAR